MGLSLSVTDATSTTDIIQLVPSINWSGDIAQCGRTLSFGVVSSATDKNMPIVELPLGAGVLLSDSVTLFEGFVFNRQKLTESCTMEITCFDRGIYVKRNKAVYKFTNWLPEDIAKRVCDDFGISTGSLARTNTRISRNFIGTSLYQIIQTAYTLAAKTTGEKYHIRFDGSALTVSVKAVTPETLVIQGGSNLMSAAVTESIERMVNQVSVYNAEDKLIKTLRDDELIKLYGIMQESIKQAKGENVSLSAQKLLDDNGVSQKITINNLGNTSLITGNSVVVQEPYTGLFGLFWIDSDIHSWKNGMYFNKLVLNFKRMMDEQEAGSLPVAEKSGSGSKKAEPVQEKWEYIRKKPPTNQSAM